MAAVVLALALVPAQAPGKIGADLRERGQEHHFNLDYKEALAVFYEALEKEGACASVWNHIANVFLYKELHRTGKLEPSAFRHDAEFKEKERPDPDPEAVEKFLGSLHEARRLAEADLAKDENDKAALFSLANNYALEANYLYMIDNSPFAALGAAGRARRFSNRLRETYPEFYDGYLVAGVQEYVIGSLPWAVRALIVLGGVRGSKSKGKEWITTVAEKGDLLKTEAKVLLTVFYRREDQPLEAVPLLEELARRYPRNYIFRLELGAMYAEGRKLDKALEVFRKTSEMVAADSDGYGRMPELWREALNRKIDALEEETAEQGGSKRASGD